MGSKDELEQFVNKFVHEYLAVPLEERLPPFRLVEDTVTPEELPGHCCEWTAQYLYGQRCPVHWVSVVCKEVMKIMADEDLTQYKRPSSASSSEGSDDTSIEIYLDAAKLCKLTFRTMEQLMRTWSTGLPSGLSDVCSNHPHLISHHAIKNTRRKMEDRHTIVPSMSLFTDKEDWKHSSLYAVFDGHGGVDASFYSVAQILPNLIELSGKDKSQALIEAITKTDQGFSRKSARENLRSGATALVMIVDPDAMYLSWLGDSQALLVRSGRVEDIMNPHKPEREDEKARIEGLGGCVIWFGTWRVNGNLAVSRAIGDVDHKPYISADPDVNRIPRVGTEEYIVLACDGLWDVITPDKTVELVYEHIQAGNSHNSVAEMLVRAARNEGSGDNITIIVVFFKQDISKPDPLPVANDEESAMENDDSIEDGEATENSSAPGKSTEKSDESNLREPTENLNSNNPNEISQNKESELLRVDVDDSMINNEFRSIYPTIAVTKSANMLNTENYTVSKKLSVSENDLTLPSVTPDSACSSEHELKNPLSLNGDDSSKRLLPIASIQRSKSSSPRPVRRQGHTKLPSAYLVFDPIMQPKPPLAKSKSVVHRQPTHQFNRKHRKLGDKSVQRRESIDVVLRHKKSSLESLSNSPLSSRGTSPARLPKFKDQSNNTPCKKSSGPRRSSIQTQLKQLSVTGDKVKSRKVSLPTVLNKTRNNLLPPIDGKLAGSIREYTSEFEE